MPGPSRSGLLTVLAVVGGGVLLTLVAFMLRPAGGPPTVVIVTVDTLRADHVGAYGRVPSPTPSIDALAARGVVFENAWTTAPLTVPAHASLFTGLLPPLHGLRTNAGGSRLPAAAARPYSTLVEAFRAAGSRTGAFLSASVLRREATGLDAGFDVYDELPAPEPGALHDRERRGMDTVEAALAWLAAGDGPAFLWVHLFDPHAPYDAPPPWGAGTSHAADATGYAGEVRYADHCVGELLAGLERAGHGDALVVLCADHGEALGEHGEPTHGYLLHEATLRVPLIVAAPGRLGEGLRRPEPVSLIDVAPTVLALAGRPLPEGMGGLPLLARDAPAQRALYAETLYGWEGCRWAQLFALRVDARKLVDTGGSVLEFDLTADPGEREPQVSEGRAPAPIVADVLRPRAALERLGRPSATPDDLAGGSYWGSGGTPTTVLAPEANAALPSPYERMPVLALLDEARSLLTAGDAANGLARLEEAARLDPGNPQVQRWRGRALLARDEPGRAAHAFRAAFALGWRHPDCVSKALQASTIAVRAGDPGEAEAGLGFLEDARGQGVRQVGAACVFEALLRLERGDFEAAREALERARGEPSTPWLERAIEGTRKLLDARNATPPR